MKVFYKSTLEIYDKVELFEAIDEIGGNYLALLYDEDNDFDHYVIVGVEPGVLQKFKVGSFDLRDIFVKRIQDVWYTGHIKHLNGDPIILDKHQQEIIDEKYLPEKGLFLYEPVDNDDNELILRSRERNALLINLSLESSESYLHKANLSCYTKILEKFEICMKRALPQELRKEVGLNILVPATIGSVSVFLEATNPLPLFQEYPISKALEVDNGKVLEPKEIYQLTVIQGILTDTINKTPTERLAGREVEIDKDFAESEAFNILTKEDESDE